MESAPQQRFARPPRLFPISASTQCPLRLGGILCPSRSNSFVSYHIPVNPAVSCNYALFCATARRYPFCNQSSAHSFVVDGGGRGVLQTNGRLLLQALPGALENPRGLLVKQHKINGFERTPIAQMLCRLMQHDLRALLHRESRDARADGRERNRLQAAFRRKPQRMRRGAPQALRRGQAPQPHARRVDHIPGLKLPARGDGRESQRDAANRVAFALDRIAALAADRSRNSRAQNEIVVCGVHNRVCIHLRQVALLDHHSRRNFLPARLAHRDSVNSLSATTMISLPMRRPTSRHRETVSSEVCGVHTNSSASSSPALERKRMPMQRSGQNVTAANSAIESEGELLAKTALGLANLSKMVNISIFISISSATASTIRSASRTASSILLARTSRVRASAPTFAPFAIHAAACSSLLSDTSSRMVRYPASSAQQAISRPWSPAPITAIVWISLAISVRVTRCKSCSALKRVPAAQAAAGALVPWNSGINLGGPAINSAGQRFRARHSLAAQPNRHVQAAHSVMAVANHFVIGVQRLQIRGNRAHGNQLRAGDAANLKFPRLAHVHQQNAVAALQPLFRLGRSNLQIIHAKFPISNSGPIIGWKPQGEKLLGKTCEGKNEATCLEISAAASRKKRECLLRNPRRESISSAARLRGSAAPSALPCRGRTKFASPRESQSPGPARFSAPARALRSPVAPAAPRDSRCRAAAPPPH